MFIILIMIKGTLRFHQNFEEFNNDCTFLRHDDVQFFNMKLQRFIEIHKDHLLFKRHISKLMSSPIDKCSWCEQYLVNKKKILGAYQQSSYYISWLVAKVLLEQLKMSYDHQHVEVLKLHILTEPNSVLRNVLSIPVPYFCYVFNYQCT